MIAFMLLAPLIFVATIMTMFAAMMSMLAFVATVVIGALVGALIMFATALLGMMLFFL